MSKKAVEKDATAKIAKKRFSLLETAERYEPAPKNPVNQTPPEIEAKILGEILKHPAAVQCCLTVNVVDLKWNCYMSKVRLLSKRRTLLVFTWFN